MTSKKYSRLLSRAKKAVKYRQVALSGGGAREVSRRQRQMAKKGARK